MNFWGIFLSAIIYFPLNVPLTRIKQNQSTYVITWNRRRHFIH